MLRVCEKLREADAKRKRLGLVRAETDYLRALLDAMADMDRLTEVEVLKSLGDVNLEKGRLKGKDVTKLDRAMVLYRTALLRCKDADVGESLECRYRHAEKLRIGKATVTLISHEPSTNANKMKSIAKMAETFQQLDRRLTSDYSKDSLLIEYTKLMVEGIANEDGMLEVEAIKSLGDVFLKRGTETRDTTCLTKATALYSTALSQCEGFQGTMTLIHRLLYTARIRQAMKSRRHQARKHRRQQQQQSDQPRDFPVIRHATGQQFMTPSEYIGSQTSKPPAPDKRSYVDDLTAGDRALADGNLDTAEQRFASALRLIHDPNKPERDKEADCLCRLGNVYVQRGKTTKEGRKFTQAAALYNAAMARTDTHKDKINKSLQETEKWFLRHTANVDSALSPLDSTTRHQKRLEDMRARAKSQLDAIDQQHNPYQYDEDDPRMLPVEAKRAEAIKALFKTIAKTRQILIQKLIDECIATLGPPPCKYAFIGLGSQATELVTPYSDLEFAILIEDGKDNDDTRWYFLNLTHYLHLKVINLGETILPAMAIPSLNDFYSDDPDKNWFFDSVTPRGFSFDGFMPWACKTPFGRDKTKTKQPLSLIQTPANMAQFQELEVSLSEGYHLSDILRRVVFLAGEEALVSQYREKLDEVITDYLLSHFQSRMSARQILWENKEMLTTFEPTGQLLNVKKDIYRFPGIAIEILALCCQIRLASTWSVIDRLKEMRQVQEENATHLTVLTSISAELRLRTYMANRGQKDSLSPLGEMKHHLGSSWSNLGDEKKAICYYEQSLTMVKIIYGQTTVHPDIAALLNNMGLSYSNLGNQQKAAKYYEQSLMMKKAIYGETTCHQDIAMSINNVGFAWSKLGNHEKAISYFEESLMMLRAVYGKNAAHLEIATVLDNIGSSWLQVGDYRKAISYFEKLIPMRQIIYGDNTAHPKIAGRLHKLGLSWRGLGDEEKAINFFEQSLTMWNTIYGDNTAHAEIAAVLHNLGVSWSKLGDQKKAISYYEQSLEMEKTIKGPNTADIRVARLLTNLGRS
ncbi:TTC28 [Branchiostoma lanceolatum]|uniref:TTC28 protein n=1 Tax=Branchiostoma lanceolatum TaxID=7740 RepID=A0A8J9Z170_BRALA|nr:TTC28 [Branchiostoma lanceolatum]